MFRSTRKKYFSKNQLHFEHIYKIYLKKKQKKTIKCLVTFSQKGFYTQVCLVFTVRPKMFLTRSNYYERELLNTMN